MPGQSHNDGTVASVIIIILLFQPGSDEIVDLLVVVFGRSEDATGLPSASFFGLQQCSIVKIKVSSAGTGEGKGTDEIGSSGRGTVRTGSVTST